MKNEIFKYNGNPITFNIGSGVMVNATEMAKPFSKKVRNWLDLPSAKEYLVTLNKKAMSENLTLTDNQFFGSAIKVYYDGLVVTARGGSNPGTWMHEDAALEFARWLSPTFAIWTNERIRELITTGKTEIRHEPQKPLSQLEILAQSIAILQEQDRKMTLIENKQTEIERKVANIEERTNSNIGYSTVVAFIRRHGLRVSPTRISGFGMRAKTICVRRGYDVMRVDDPRWGYVNMYPDDVLNEVFSIPLFN